MKVHEYQAKQILSRFGIPTPSHHVAETPEEALQAAKDLASDVVVLKAQVHAGGRGKGRFAGSEVGGVKVMKGTSEVEEIARTMIGGRLVTHQTGSEGTVCRKILVEAGVAIERELYLAVVLDRASSRPVVMASAEGGMDIEEVAATAPEKILRERVDPGIGLHGFQARRLGYGLGLPSGSVRAFAKVCQQLVRAFVETDASLAEINPLIRTESGDIMALDAKMSFDDNALFRHEDLKELRDTAEEDPAEVEAKKYSLSYIALDGSIGCMVNGAGLAMATMDLIKHHGAEPANFLDVGGGATTENVTAAFRIICSDPSVKAILVNIFGGIMRCDVIAEGIIGAVKQVELGVPLVVRLEGTNVEKGKELLRNSGLPIQEAEDLDDAAARVVAAAG